MGFVIMGRDWYYCGTTESGWTLWSPYRAQAWVASSVDAVRSTARQLVASESHAVRVYRAAESNVENFEFSVYA